MLIILVIGIMLSILHPSDSRVVGRDGANYNNINHKDYSNRYNNVGQPYHHTEVRKCLREVPLVLLEHDFKHKVISEGKDHYHGKIEVCCDGYERSKYDWNECVPKCENGCNHGSCIRPEVCECFPGYVKSHEEKCVLTCPVFCLNGKCKLDGTCQCNSGYELDESEEFCKPICQGLGTDCSYRYNQYCSAPNTCSCIKGYKLTGSGCEPICEQNCGIHGTCFEPNRCRCEVGYYLKNGLCQAECYQTCENGLCEFKNRCICFEGYKYDERTTTCVPVDLKKFRVENL